MVALMDILLELCKFVSSQAENGVKLETTMNVLIIYGRGKVIRLGVSIAIAVIWTF
jgi:hypothetical protein